MPIIKAIESLTQKKYLPENYFENNQIQKEINRNFKIISDHFRACVFAIADGASPSSKDRGSIIRRLFRRSMICLKHLDILDNFVRPIVLAIIDVMNNAYPYLNVHQEKIIKILEGECNSFKQTLNIGYDLFNKEIKNNTLNSNTIFKLVDTYGFPFELIEDLSKEKNISIDRDAYQRKVIEHQNISRKKTNESGMASVQSDLSSFNLPSTFSYESLSINDAVVIGIFDENFKKIEQLTKKG
jgi:alanyl-tRNA synthetase